jgi:uncharacterized protein YjbI with pentapeptide repeats
MTLLKPAEMAPSPPAQTPEPRPGSVRHAYSQLRAQLWHRLDGPSNRIVRWTLWPVRLLVAVLDVPIRWLASGIDTLISDRGYITAGSIGAVYLAVFGLIDAKSTQEQTRASIERSLFMTLVSSGNPASFVSAMKAFGPTQTVLATRHPEPLEFWGWNGKTQPNMEPMHLWAASADLSGSDLRGANLRETHLENVHLRGANLSGANLSDATLSDANLSDATLTTLRGPYLIGATLSDANLSDATLSDATGNTYLRGAKLRGANLESADLSGASLERAHLENANLENANLHGANLSGVDLRGAHLENANLRGANLSDAIIDGAEQLKAACGDLYTKPPLGQEIPRC